MGLPIIGSLLSAVVGMMGQSSPPSPPAPIAPPPPPPAPTVEPTKEPEAALDVEASKQRALKRRRASQTSGLSLLDNADTSTNTPKSLVGQ